MAWFARKSTAKPKGELEISKLIHRKSKTPRRLCTPDPSHPRLQHTSVNFNWPLPERPSTSVSPIAQEANASFQRRWRELDVAVKEKCTQEEAEQLLGELGEPVPDLDYPKEIQAQLKKLIGRVESLEGEKQEDIEAALLAEQQAEEMAARRRMFQKPEGPKRLNQIETLYADLEFLRDVPERVEDLEYRNLRTIRERSIFDEMGCPVMPAVTQNRKMARKLTSDYLVDMTKQSATGRNERLRAATLRKKHAVAKKESRLMAFHQKSISRIALTEQRKAEIAHRRNAAKQMQIVKGWLPLLEMARRAKFIQRRFEQYLAFRARNYHRMGAIIRVQRWARPFLERKRRRRILRGLCKLSALINGHQVRWNERRKKHAAAVLVNFTSTLLSESGSEMNAAVRTFLGWVRTGQRAWRKVRHENKLIIEARCEQIEDMLRRVCASEPEDETVVIQYNAFSKKSGLVGSSITSPWAHRDVLWNVINPALVAEWRRHIKDLDSFREKFREMYEDYERQVYECRAARVMCRDNVVFPYFNPPPRPEFKTLLTMTEMLQLAVDAIKETKRRNLVPP